MKHLVICDYGSFIGLDKHKISIKHKGKEQSVSYPLNRLRTVSIAKNGISISSDLIRSLSERGIKTFFLDFRGVAHSAILGQSQHGVVAVRMAQMAFCQRDTLPLAKKIITAKIKNQRAVLNYLDKYHNSFSLQSSSKELLKTVEQAGRAKDVNTCLIAGKDKIVYKGEKTKEELWEKYYIQAPAQRRQPVKRYKIVRRA